MTHYYSEQQDSELRFHEIPITVLGMEHIIFSASGIFSSKKLDKGTELLIKNAIITDGWDVLDLGSGCGVVGCSIALAFPGCSLTMSDVNKRAVRVARMNVKKLGLKNAKVIHSDMFDKVDALFDTILLNPPQNAGKDVCFSMIEGAIEHLKKGGLLQLVARHNKGGRQLSEKMEKVFGNVEVLDRKGGFRVYLARA